MTSVSLEEIETIHDFDLVTNTGNGSGGGGNGSVDGTGNLQSLNESLKRSLLTAAESFDMLVVMLCLASLNVTTKGGIAVYETLGTACTMTSTCYFEVVNIPNNTHTDRHMHIHAPEILMIHSLTPLTSHNMFFFIAYLNNTNPSHLNTTPPSTLNKRHPLTS